MRSIDPNANYYHPKDTMMMRNSTSYYYYYQPRFWLPKMSAQPSAMLRHSSVAHRDSSRLDSNVTANADDCRIGPNARTSCRRPFVQFLTKNLYIHIQEIFEGAAK
jgi:hypothetical protein